MTKPELVNMLGIKNNIYHMMITNYNFYKIINFAQIDA